MFIFKLLKPFILSSVAASVNRLLVYWIKVVHEAKRIVNNNFFVDRRRSKLFIAIIYLVLHNIDIVKRAVFYLFKTKNFFLCILLSMEENPHNSVCQICRDISTMRTTMHIVLKSEKWHPFKFERRLNWSINLYSFAKF